MLFAEYVVGTFCGVQQQDLEGTKVMVKILNDLIVFFVRSICYDFGIVF